MQYWWVNQNQTYQFEVSGGYMWSPKANRNGAFNQFYENMTAVSPGDVIFSFKDTFIKAVGIATGHAETAAKPTEFSAVDNPWSQEGWFVPVSFTELENPIRPKNYIDRLRPYLPTKYSPLQSNGNRCISGITTTMCSRGNKCHDCLCAIFNPSSNCSAASSCIPGTTWEYTSIVIAKLL